MTTRRNLEKEHTWCWGVLMESDHNTPLQLNKKELRNTRIRAPRPPILDGKPCKLVIKNIRYRHLQSLRVSVTAADGTDRFIHGGRADYACSIHECWIVILIAENTVIIANSSLLYQ